MRSFDKSITRKEIALLLAHVNNYYPNYEITSARLNAWTNDLEGFDATEVQQAFLAHIRTNTYPPTLADILKRIEEQTCFQGVTRESAKQIISAAVARFGFYGWEKLSDKLPTSIRQIILAIGWGNCCKLGKPELFKLIDATWSQIVAAEARPQAKKRSTGRGLGVGSE